MICTKSAGNEFLLVINTNLPPILHRFQVMADYWWSPANIAINDISLKLHWFLWPTFLRHFYVIRPESNRIRWNYAAVRVLYTPFKVIQGHRVWYQSKAPICDFLLVINSNIKPASFLRYSLRKVQSAIFGYPSCVWPPPPTWDDLRKFFTERSQMARYQMA